MSTGLLTIRLDAIADNWRALASMSKGETGAVVKADGYGLGAKQVARELARAGARSFFVAVAEEAVPLRAILGEEATIHVFSGHMAGDTEMIRDLGLVPLINSIDQLTMHVEALPGHPFGIQLDTGMNRLGMEWEEWSAVAEIALGAGASLLMSHLACADEPDHPMNPYQLDLFRQMTDGTNVRRSLAATGGILLGPDYHFDLTRPGIGLYGGLPFEEAQPAARLDLPVVQCRTLTAGEVVGYGNTWQAERETRLATINCGYADGMLRSASGGGLTLWYDGAPCPAVGRVSMDLITVDVTDLGRDPEYLSLICPESRIDDVADAAGTIGYEVLTSLGSRYQRRYARS
ncbi:alanine racemase [Pseudoroseicyclus tamaricis]|uniref:Alanine racemase n=1 Tax=Pseudoroseicyclus tamaricis TaxID=2705421 RepID=A0A6B2JSG0_9RHOB|nr:alanine racemase [Pseudoroseicyclus tamaricis]NDV00955.1 alanine racemase [Pseudoroseicyclus tamaricis]